MALLMYPEIIDSYERHETCQNDITTIALRYKAGKISRRLFIVFLVCLGKRTRAAFGPFFFL